MMHPPLTDWFGSDAYDRGCEATFAVLDRYVEAVARGDDMATRYAHVITHL